MPRIETRTVYKFDELSEQAQQKALEKQSEFEAEVFDTDFLYDEFEEVGKIIGITFDTRQIKLMNGKTRPEPCIYYSGFCSQGDGACFEGSYSYAPGALKRLIKEYPNEKDLHAIARTLQAEQRKYFYQLTASTRHTGHYYHERSMSINVSRTCPKTGDELDYSRDTEETVEECMVDFALWVYKQIENEYDYRTGAEACRESIEANDYEFTEEGEMI